MPEELKTGTAEEL
jgi:hypothetical protein